MDSDVFFIGSDEKAVILAEAHVFFCQKQRGTVESCGCAGPDLGPVCWDLFLW